MLNAMDCKVAFLKMLQAVQNFFRYKHLRVLFCSMCVVAPYESMRSYFESWPGSYIEWRWGSLLEILEHLMFLRNPLMLLWDSRKLSRGLAMDLPEVTRERQPQDENERERQRGEGDDAPTDPKEAGAVINNPRFWANVDMLLMASEVLAVMFSNVKQCPCHPSAEMLDADLRHLYADRSLKTGRFICPLMGCCGPWLATGGWRLFLQRVRQSREIELLGKCSVLLEEHRVAVLADFRAGCGAYATELSLKLDFWSSSNPYVLFGVGFSDEPAAKLCAATSVRQWNGSVNQDLEHDRTKAVFRDDVLYGDLVEFSISDKPLSDYPQLELEVAKLALSWVVEISIESKHALAKARIVSAGHNISEGYFSLALRQHEIEEFVDEKMSNLVDLSRLFSSIKNVIRFVGFWGLVQHPTISHGFQNEGQLRRKVVQGVFYHADNLTVHEKYDALVKEWKHSREKTREQISKQKSRRWKTNVLADPGVKPPPVDNDDSLLSVALAANVNKHGRVLSAIPTVAPHAVWDSAVRFVQSTSSRHEATSVFSVTAVGKMSFANLNERMRSGGVPEDPASVLFGGGCHMESESMQSRVIAAAMGDPLRYELPSHVFFDIHSLNPIRKQLLVSLAAPGIETHEISVCVRRCTHLDFHNSEARLELDSSEPPAAWTLPQEVPIEQLRVCFWEWRQTSDFTVSLVDESLVAHLDLDVVHDFFLRALSSGAWVSETLPDEQNLVHIEHATVVGKALEAVAFGLYDMGWAVKEFNLDARSAWAVTKRGLKHVRYHQKLVCIGNGLRLRDVALKDLSSYELLCKLLDDGWQLHCVAKGIARKLFDPYDCSAEPLPEGQVRRKLLYMRSLQRTLNRPYMYLLLIAEQQGSSQNISLKRKV